MPPKKVRSVSDRVAAATAVAATTSPTSTTSHTKRTLLPKMTAHLLPESRKAIQKDALHQCMWDMIVRRIDPLSKSSEPRVTSDQLRAEWNIVVQKLDLATGQPEHGETFIRPIPLHQIDSWIKECRPLDYRGPIYQGYEPEDYDLFGIFDPVEDPREGRDIAWGIGRMVDNYTGRSYPSGQGTMMDKTNWCEVFPISSNRLSFNSDVHNWAVHMMMYQCRPGASKWGSFHPVLPHVSCFVYDDEILQDDGSLSHAELSAIMVLAVQLASHLLVYYQAAVIPIVVFSCSGRQVRIVQGCIDFRRYHFDVRCSEILDLNEGGIRGTDENLRRFYTLLGWVLGEPVGNTDKYQSTAGRR